jgi:glucokinase
LDNQTGILTTSNLPGWHNLNIIAYIKERFSLDAKLENDANACALAEWKFGAGKGTKNMVFFTFGTGLGAGLILDGRLYAGTNGNAGEAGHIRLAKNGPFGFRKYGSFEGFCSGAGIAKLAVIMAKRRKTMPDCIREMGGYDKVTTKALAAAAFNGDVFAKKVFAKSGEKLGEGLSIIVDVLNPEKIVLGGVFMRSSALLVPSMQKALDREALEESASVCQIVEAGLKENIGDYAAISVALR